MTTPSSVSTSEPITLTPDEQKALDGENPSGAHDGHGNQWWTEEDDSPTDPQEAAQRRDKLDEETEELILDLAASAKTVGWLIEAEKPIAERRWWAGDSWTGDATAAIRFARQGDAQSCIDAVNRMKHHFGGGRWLEARPTEHIWGVR